MELESSRSSPNLSRSASFFAVVSGPPRGPPPGMLEIPPSPHMGAQASADSAKRQESQTHGLGVTPRRTRYATLHCSIPARWLLRGVLDLCTAFMLARHSDRTHVAASPRDSDLESTSITAAPSPWPLDLSPTPRDADGFERNLKLAMLKHDQRNEIRLMSETSSTALQTLSSLNAEQMNTERSEEMDDVAQADCRLRGDPRKSGHYAEALSVYRVGIRLPVQHVPLSCPLSLPSFQLRWPTARCAYAAMRCCTPWVSGHCSHR